MSEEGSEKGGDEISKADKSKEEEENGEMGGVEESGVEESGMGDEEDKKETEEDKKETEEDKKETEEDKEETEEDKEETEEDKEETEEDKEETEEGKKEESESGPVRRSFQVEKRKDEGHGEGDVKRLSNIPRRKLSRMERKRSQAIDIDEELEQLQRVSRVNAPVEEKSDVDDDNVDIDTLRPPPKEEETAKKAEERKKEDKTVFNIQVQKLGITFQEEMEIREKPFMGSVLENHLNEQDLEELMKKFEQYPDYEMDINDFQRVLQETVHISYSQPELELLFKKMDTDVNGKVGWSEFLSYVLLEIQAKSAAELVEDLVQPLAGYPRLFRSKHRFPVVRVAFFPVMQPDRTISFLIGRYATISRDGRLNYWTLDFELDGTASAAPAGSHRITESWVTDMVCLPDVSVVCTCSTSRDLCFFDTTAGKFEIRLTITHLHQPVLTMAYHFWQDETQDSYLVCGDIGGNVMVFSFQNFGKGPFQYTHSQTHITLRLDQVIKGRHPRISAQQYLRLHGDSVKQVGFFSPTKCMVSCAATNEASLVLMSLLEDNFANVVSHPRGITSFVIVEEKHLIVTGCVSGAVLVWDVYAMQKPSVNLPGHLSPVITVVAQDECRRIYSMARDRSVKCWDVVRQKCIQTYLGVPAEVGAAMTLSCSYNPVNRSLVIAGSCLALLTLGVAVDHQRSDGYTHTMAVVRAMYNPLYKCVVTVGLDSVIMMWDVWEGKRTLLIRDAHTRSYYGVPTPMEITAATFDPAYQHLATGARDGSLKIWNFNLGYCVRTMNVELFCEVTRIVWLRGRILVVGWDRHVTEFSDTDYYAEPKVWETRHTDDVLCMVVREGQTIATSSYNGELVLWRADTGQAYRRFNVGTPHARIILTYSKETKKKEGSSILLAGTMHAMQKRTTYVGSHYTFRKFKQQDSLKDFISSKPPGTTTDFVLSTRAPEKRRSSGVARPSIVVRSKDPILSIVAAGSAGPATAAAAMAAGSGVTKIGSGSEALAALVAAAAAAVERRGSSASLHSIPSQTSSARGSFVRRSSLGGTKRGSSVFNDPVAAALRHAFQNATEGMERRHTRRVSVVKLPVVPAGKRQVYVSAMVFLDTRPMHPDWGTLFVSLDKGLTQVWSHHTGGRYLGSFLSIHMAGDYVTAMSTDNENKYLFTGTSLGYIKIWLMSNYAFPDSEKVAVCMPRLRLQFPFMWKDRVEGRAKRSLRDQPLPILLNSYRGHLMAIYSIEFVEDHNFIITSSSDTSVRLWSLSGQYLGTLGGHQPWTAFTDHKPRSEVEKIAKKEADEREERKRMDEANRRKQIYGKDVKTPEESLLPLPVQKEHPEHRIPADVKLVMSSTTLKVFMGGNVPHTYLKLVDDSDLLRDLPEELLSKATFGKRPGSPLLGKYITMSGEEPTEEPPFLNVSGREIPVYTHLRVGTLDDVPHPHKPRMLVEMRRRQKTFVKKKRQPEPAFGGTDRRTRASIYSKINTAIHRMSFGSGPGASLSSTRTSISTAASRPSVASTLTGASAVSSTSTASQESSLGSFESKKNEPRKSSIDGSID